MCWSKPSTSNRAARPAEPAEALIAETLADPGVVEVGYHDGLRYTVTLDERPAADGQPGMAAGSRTRSSWSPARPAASPARSSADLAAASGGTFYLLDLVPAPQPRRSADRALPQPTRKRSSAS